MSLLWRQTTVSQEWLAEQLQMQSAANVSQLLRRAQKHRGAVRLPRALSELHCRFDEAARPILVVKICTLTLTPNPASVRSGYRSRRHFTSEADEPTDSLPVRS